MKNKIRPGTAALLILTLLSAPLAARETGRPEPPAGREAGGDARAPGEKPALERATRDFLSDAGRIWSSPFRVKRRHVAPLLAFAVTTGLLISADESVRRAVKTYGAAHPWVDDAGSVVTQMGGLGAVGTAGILLGVGLVFKDGRARDTGCLAASAMVQAMLVEQAFKGLTGRRRPFVEDGVDHWSGPAGFFKRFNGANNGLYDSFPSGHTTMAFSLATVIALRYRHPTWVPVLAYTIAAGVGLSRVTEDRHWISDVVVGAVIGHLVARLVVRGHDRRRRLVPVLGCSGHAITLGFHYTLGPFD